MAERQNEGGLAETICEFFFTVSRSRSCGKVAVMHLPDAHALLQALASGVLLGGLYAIAALGLSLALGVLRLVNLAHGEWVVLGSYLGYLLLQMTGMDPLLGLFLILPLVAVLAFAVERVLLAPLRGAPSDARLLTMFGLSVIAQNAFILVFTGNTHAISRSYGISAFQVGSLSIPRIYFISFVFALVVVGAVHVVLHRTAFGRQIRASAEDPEAAAVVGVPVDRVFAMTLAIAGGCATLGGILSGIAFSFTPTTGTVHLLTGFTIVVLGGLGSVAGTLMGGIAIGVIESLGALIAGDGYREFIGLSVFLLFLGLRPQGMFGRKDR
jgi:branched-chain amino acid transport system permease protein